MKWKMTLKEAGQLVAGFGLLLILVDLVLRAGPIPSGPVVLAEGQPFDSQSEQEQLSSPGNMQPGTRLPPIAFQPLNIDPGYGPSGEPIPAKARIRVQGEVERELEFSSENDVEVDGVHVGLHAVGLAPVFIVQPSPETKSFPMVVNLNIWTPDAREDSFQIAPLGTTVWARFFPDFEETPEGPTSRSMAPRNPVLHVRIVPDAPGGPSGEGFLRPNESVQFGDASLRLVEFRHWGRFHIYEKRNRQLAALGLIAIVLGSAGPLLTERLYRKQPNSPQAVES